MCATLRGILFIADRIGTWHIGRRIHEYTDGMTSTHGCHVFPELRACPLCPKPVSCQKNKIQPRPTHSATINQNGQKQKEIVDVVVAVGLVGPTSWSGARISKWSGLVQIDG